jgi:hypothetical protein
MTHPLSDPIKIRNAIAFLFRFPFKSWPRALKSPAKLLGQPNCSARGHAQGARINSGPPASRIPLRCSSVVGSAVDFVAKGHSCALFAGTAPRGGLRSACTISNGDTTPEGIARSNPCVIYRIYLRFIHFCVFVTKTNNKKPVMRRRMGENKLLF